MLLVNKTNFNTCPWGRKTDKLTTYDKLLNLYNLSRKNKFNNIKTYSTFKIGDLIVNDVPESKDQWIVIQDEAFLPDKNKFITMAFERDWKNLYDKLVGSDDDKAMKIYSLASRSTVLNEWLAKQNMLYSYDAQMPTYYKDFMDYKTFNDLRRNIQSLSSINSKLAQDLNSLAAKYKRDVEDLNNKARKQVLELTNKSKELQIVTLPTTSLPLSIQLKIDNYTPADNESPSARVYAREMLVNYKLALLQKLKDDPDVDINKLIDSLKNE